jgi:SNF2 family DNA or RNA helicase
MYGAQICAGLETLGHEFEPGKTSVKLDWVVDKLTGDLYDDKVVVFCQFKDTIRALHKRLDAERVGYVTMWGDEPDPEWRRAQQKKFWDDPKTRVCIGTSAMEQSLNLQVSNILINVDMLMNPKRMEQLAGRIRRFGSAHSHAWVFNLLTRDTQEERYLPIVESREALSDFVFGERSELFEQLSPTQLLALIKP